jgi:hypothetical protein
MAYPFRVALTEERRAELRGPVGGGGAPARTLARARILLRADHGGGSPGRSAAALAGAPDVDPGTVQRGRRRFVPEGLAATPARKRPDRVDEREPDGRGAAHPVALACAAPPAGHRRRTPRPLADELVRLEAVAAVSHETVRRTPKTTAPSRG